MSFCTIQEAEGNGKILDKDFAICDYGAFKNRLDEAREMLYIGDNAGKCVFDRILIGEIKKPEIYIRPSRLHPKWIAGPLIQQMTVYGFSL